MPLLRWLGADPDVTALIREAGGEILVAVQDFTPASEEGVAETTGLPGWFRLADGVIFPEEELWTVLVNVSCDIHNGVWEQVVDLRILPGPHEELFRRISSYLPSRLPGGWEVSIRLCDPAGRDMRIDEWQCQGQRISKA